MIVFQILQLVFSLYCKSLIYVYLKSFLAVKKKKDEWNIQQFVKLESGFEILLKTSVVKTHLHRQFQLLRVIVGNTVTVKILLT